MKKNKTLRNILIFIGVAIILGVLISSFNLLTQEQITSRDFVNPEWARLECAPTGTWSAPAQQEYWLDEYSMFYCNFFTEECRFKITNDPKIGCLSLFHPTGTYSICDSAGKNCKGSYTYNVCDGASTDFIFLKVGESVKFNTGVLVTGEDTTRITFQYDPWKLYRFVGGARYVVNSENCDISSKTKGNILEEDYPGSKLYRVGEEGQRWINYINAWNYGPPTNVFYYKGRQVYCNSAKLYEIVTLKLSNGELVKLDPTYGGRKEDGTLLSGMGKFIENVDCCPNNEPNCGNDFKYKQTNSTCFTDAQCTNAGGPIPQGTEQPSYVKYVCENSICTKKGPFYVECTDNSDCSGNQICDLSTTNYGTCITQSSGSYCGDGICDYLIESYNNCPKDCGSENPNVCSNCLSWGLNVFKDDNSKCETTVVWKPDNFWGKLLGIQVTQDDWCPLILIVYGGFISVFLVFIIIFIRKRRPN